MEKTKTYMWTVRTSVKSNHGNEALTLALQGITCSYHNNNNNALQLNAISCLTFCYSHQAAFQRDPPVHFSQVSQTFLHSRRFASRSDSAFLTCPKRRNFRRTLKEPQELSMCCFVNLSTNTAQKSRLPRQPSPRVKTF